MNWRSKQLFSLTLVFTNPMPDIPEQDVERLAWTDIWVKVEILGVREEGEENHGTVALTYTPGLKMAAVKAILMACAESIKGGPDAEGN